MKSNRDVHRPGENQAHFLTKLFLYYCLRSKGHQVRVEFEYLPGRFADLYDITDKIIYEIETNIKSKNTQRKIKQIQEELPYIDVILVPIKEEFKVIPIAENERFIYP